MEKDYCVNISGEGNGGKEELDRKTLVARLRKEFEAIPYYFEYSTEAASKLGYGYGIVPYALDDWNRIKLPGKRYFTSSAATSPVSRTSDVEEKAVYINASAITNPFLNGPRHRHYIATEAPSRSTMANFLLMAYHQRVRSIAMLCSFSERWVRCEKYWADSEAEAEADSNRFAELLAYEVGSKLSVSGSGHRSERCDYVVRQLVLRPRKENNRSKRPPLHLHHLQFIGWPDLGVPHNPQDVLNFLDKMDELLQQGESEGMAEIDAATEGNLHGINDSCAENAPEPPVLIHCGAGVGRTGTLIALDMLRKLHACGKLDLQQKVKRGEMRESEHSFSSAFCASNTKITTTTNDGIDLRAVVEELRKQRMLMVDDASQYVLLYDAIMTCV